MAQGLPPLDANIMDLQTDIPEDEEDWEAELLSNFALMIDNEISQLKKLGTWVIENLLKGHNVILCSTMLREKHSPDDRITLTKCALLQEDTDRPRE